MNLLEINAANPIQQLALKLPVCLSPVMQPCEPREQQVRGRGGKLSKTFLLATIPFKLQRLAVVTLRVNQNQTNCQDCHQDLIACF